MIDYPTAWAICDETLLTDHDPRCSYRATDRAILCDCDVLNKRES